MKEYNKEEAIILAVGKLLADLYFERYKSDAAKIILEHKLEFIPDESKLVFTLKFTEEEG